MDYALSIEMRYLLYVALLLLVMWIPYILAQIAQLGLVAALSYRDEDKMPDWAKRLKRAHYNLVENFAPFAAIVLTGEVIGLHTAATAACAAIFFWARVVHPFAQVIRVWGTRTLAFAVGWVATLVYAWLVLTAVAQPDVMQGALLLPSG
jgi:uncharacterized MAPEG superfamily protein